MKAVGRKEQGEIFEKFWNEVTQEFFKIEVLQDYTGEDDGPSLQAWLNGKKKKSLYIMKEEVHKDEFFEWANSKKEIDKIRLRIVEKPYTPYTVWEIELYKNFNIPYAGEKVFLLDKKSIDSIWLPEGDTLIFDQKRVISNHYNKNGFCIGADIYDETDDISKFLELKEMLLKMPLEKVVS